MWRVGRKLCRLRKEKSLPCILGPTQQQHKKEFLFFFKKKRRFALIELATSFELLTMMLPFLMMLTIHSIVHPSTYIRPPFFFRLVSLTSSSFCCCCCYSNFYLFFPLMPSVEDSVEKKLRQKHFFFPFSIHDWPDYTWIKYMKLSMIFFKIISVFHDGFCSESSLM